MVFRIVVSVGPKGELPMVAPILALRLGTPAQQLGLATRVYDWKDILYFK